MNAARRKVVAELLDILSEAQSKLEAIKDEENEAFENLPEGLQQGERGEAMQTAANQLEDALSNLESCISDLESVE